MVGPFLYLYIKGRTMKKAKAFTLVEILIVVVLLGVLAAIVLPAFGSGAMSAKQSALGQDLRILERLILIYKCHHLEVTPGYPGGDETAAPTEAAFIDQATMASNAAGQTAVAGTPGFARGPYLMKIPTNPINNLNTIQMLADGEDFPANADNSHGWIYKAATGEIHPDCTGADTNGDDYYGY